MPPFLSLQSMLPVKIATGLGLIWLCWLWQPHALVEADVAGPTIVSPARFHNLGNVIELDRNWIYQVGDDHAWAAPDFDDSDWQIGNPWAERDRNARSPTDGQKVGWARMHLAVDSTIWQTPLALHVYQRGAAEIYLDGNLIHQFGQVGASQAQTNAYVAKVIQLGHGTHHVLAVRYANVSTDARPPLGSQAGIRMFLFRNPHHMLEDQLHRVKTDTREQMFFTGVPLAFAILHVFLFLFYPSSKENLYYASFTGFMAAATFMDYEQGNAESFPIIHRILLICMIVSAIRFTYSLFYPKLPKAWYLFLTAGLGLVMWTVWEHSRAIDYILGLGLLILVEILRVIVVAVLYQKDGAWILGLGALPFIVAAASDIAMDFGLLGPILGTSNPYLYGSLGLMISMSVYLARRFAHTNTALEIRSKELFQLNRDLENRVEQRTVELAQANSQLQTRNQFIREVFGRYLTDNVVTNLLESPAGLKVGGAKQKVTNLVADLRGFTSVSESLPPEQVVLLLNTYLEAMTEVILKYEGTIDEFLGDGILVIFGAPIWRDNDAERAVACAVEMELAMGRVNQQNQRLGLPDIAMGIGINTGEVVVGNIGSLKRMKYGIVGSDVNLAYRIESYTSGGQILISEATLKETMPLVKIKREMEVRPKGFTGPITIYEVHGMSGIYNLTL